jgi:putative flippase GtrA
VIKSLIHPGNQKHISQLFRYGLIGITVNLVSYLAYLFITYLGGTPKLTMSVLYVVAAFVSFLGNRNLTFAHKGGFLGSGLRFSIAHLLGYLINLGLLFVLVDKYAYPHQLVQVCAIIIVAIFLFLTFKFFVFSEEKNQ